MPDMTVIGVSDPDLTRAAEVAAKARCPAFADYREMCARLKPDFAFALGRHCDMAEEARFLIAERIPFAMEKPCAITAADAHDIAARAAAGQPVRRGAVRDPLQPADRHDPRGRRRRGGAIRRIQVRRRHGGPLPRAACGMDAASRHRRRRTAAQSWRALPRSLPRAAAGHEAACRRLRDVEPPRAPRHRGPRGRADARRRRDLHGGDRLSLSRAEFGVRPALLDPHRGPLLRRARQPDAGDPRQRSPPRGAVDAADQFVLLSRPSSRTRCAASPTARSRSPISPTWRRRWTWSRPPMLPAVPESCPPGTSAGSRPSYRATQRSRNNGRIAGRPAHRHRLGCDLPVVLHRQAPARARAGHAGAGRAALLGPLEPVPAQPRHAEGRPRPRRLSRA